ncbi:MAG: anhydro-N-acetylmuramic acid kinase [Planctomycetota bacterium]|nr:anhydro-N-acetylmuramic acid kinase [Planctomycetota bacterium]
MAERTRMIVGCMTGTSIDALDASLVEVLGSGLSMRARVIDSASFPLGSLAGPLRAAAEQRPASAGEFAGLARDFGVFHAESLRGWLGERRADLIVVHGQTVFHAPPVSWQLMNPAPVARALGARVCFDLRAGDLAAGGQGAPITPIADAVLFSGDESRAIVNLGGFCNVTLLPARGGAEPDVAGVRGLDVCACNHVLDGVARRALGAAYDEGGNAALSGRADVAAADELTALLGAQRAGGRSLGTGDELSKWIEGRLGLSGADLAATACRAVGRAIAGALPAGARVFAAGGGVRNAALRASIGEAIGGGSLETTAALGVAPEARESVSFAVLGALAEDRVPITLPAVTGRPAGAVLSGAWMSG